MSSESISEFAAELGIEDGQLIRFHRECVKKHKDGADEWLLAWLYVSWQELRDEPRFPAKQNGLLHPPQYVSTAVRAIDDAESVPSVFQNVLTLEAHSRHATRRAEDAKEEHAEEQARQLARQLRDVAVAIHRAGGNPVEFLAGVQREISAKRDELRDAA